MNLRKPITLILLLAVSSLFSNCSLERPMESKPEATAVIAPVAKVDMPDSSKEDLNFQNVIASFYGKGDGLNGRRTANGEVFNTDKLTAAHRTLPFGTMLKVINTKNGKEVHVRINDRGPYGRGRGLDLSYAAAKQLDMVQSGTGKVKIAIVPNKIKADV